MVFPEGAIGVLTYLFNSELQVTALPETVAAGSGLHEIADSADQFNSPQGLEIVLNE
jgi:hypothetical protein